MRFTLRVFVLALPVAALAQSRFVDEDESILFAKVQLEKDAAQQIRYLTEWESRYPQTYFASNRCERFSAAYERLQMYHEAFHYAVVCAALESAGPEALHRVVLLARTLASPTAAELNATVQSARLILEAVHGLPRSTATQPDERRVENMIRDLRSQDALRMRRDARDALAWAGRQRHP